MHTEHLAQGLEIFVIGLGGVFANLALIYLVTLLVAWALKGLESSGRSPRGD